MTDVAIAADAYIRSNALLGGASLSNADHIFIDFHSEALGPSVVEWNKIVHIHHTDIEYSSGICNLGWMLRVSRGEQRPKHQFAGMMSNKLAKIIWNT